MLCVPGSEIAKLVYTNKSEDFVWIHRDLQIFIYFLVGAL